MRQHIRVSLTFLTNTNQWLSQGEKGEKKKPTKTKPYQTNKNPSKNQQTPNQKTTNKTQNNTPNKNPTPFSRLCFFPKAEQRYHLIIRSASLARREQNPARGRNEKENERGGNQQCNFVRAGLSGDSQAQKSITQPFCGNNNYESSTSFLLQELNNSPLFIRPTTVNSKYLLLSDEKYRPNMVAVLFVCSLNVESKYTSFSVGSPSASCKKFVPTLLLEYGRRSKTEK